VKSVCAVFWKCQNCQLTMKRSARSPQEHVCYEWRCGCCKEYTTDDLHKCYLQPLEPKKPGYKYIFFDLECVQESGQHEVNLAVAQLCCEDCIDSPDINSPCKCGVRCTQCYTWLQSKKAHKKPLCDGCGHRQIIVKDGENTLDKFCKWLFDKSHYGYTVIAHNMKAYDGQLLNQYIVRNGIRAKYIYSGSKIMYMHLQNGTNIRLVDSLNFFAQSLSSLPDAFGLDGVKKGHFPHFFNTWSNQDYVGPYPPPGMYGADQMTSKARKKFDEWYNGVTDQTFDFAKELVEYCVDDVNILRRACLTFRALMMGLTKETDGEDDEEEPDADDSDDEYDTEEAAYALEEELEAEERRKNQKKKHAGIDPFQHITLASLCTHVYRSKFYHTTDTEQDPPIGQIPAGGYARYRQCSKVAISWLEYVMHTEDIHIRHALNHPAGEYKVPGTKIIADGYCRATNTLFFFNGCVFHACDTCNTCVRHPVTGQKGWEIRKKDEDHMIQLAERGYKVRVIWEHEYRKRLRQDKEMKEFVDSLDIQERLDPR
jgi:G:T-mismatch repair DNA endonuclease (very short patch repair protein)